MKKSNLSKLILAISFILLNVGIASSQVRFGLKGGFDVNSNRINKDILNAHNRLGFQIGGTLEVMAPFTGWGGELSVLYGHQKFDIDGVKGSSNKDYDLSNYNYLRIPLNLKKKFSVLGLLGIFVAAGPYAEIKLNGGDFKEKGGFEQFKSKSFGMGINAGAGVELLKHLEVGMYYRKALTNDYASDTPSIGDYLWKKKPSNWSVNLTYFF